jgi:hypothetical protein
MACRISCNLLFEVELLGGRLCGNGSDCGSRHRVSLKTHSRRSCPGLRPLSEERCCTEVSLVFATIFSLRPIRTTRAEN